MGITQSNNSPSLGIFPSGVSNLKQSEIAFATSSKVMRFTDYLETALLKMATSLVNQKIVTDRLIRNGQRTILIPLLAILHFGSVDGLDLVKVNDFMLSSADAKIDFAF
jgi:hypothetical protein